jgi:hypothetical protein
MSNEALAVVEHPALSATTATLPVMSGPQMVDALKRYRDLQRALDESMPDQIMLLDGKPFRKKGYWRAIRMAFNLCVESITPEDRERSVLGTLEDSSENYVYSVTYRATAPSGATAMGDGTCAAAEKQRGKMKATEHNVRSHAHTRAFNRAVSNLVGFGEVSAEEVQRDDEHHDARQSSAHAPTTSAPSDGQLRVVAPVERQDGTSKNGKPYTRYVVTLSDGRKASTFDEEIGRLASTFARDGIVVEVDIAQAGKFSNLNGIKASHAATPAHPASESQAPAGTTQVLTVAKVVELGTRGDQKLYGIITAELGEGAVLMTTDKEHARAALSARKNGQKIGAKWTERDERKGDETTVARYLTDVSLQLEAAEEPDGEVRELADNDIAWGSRG